jgi:hypothetical protein
MFWAFKMSFVVDILAFFALENFWDTFEKLVYFSNLLVILVVSQMKSFLGLSFVRVMSYYDETLLA